MVKIKTIDIALMGVSIAVFTVLGLLEFNVGNLIHINPMSVLMVTYPIWFGPLGIISSIIGMFGWLFIRGAIVPSSYLEALVISGGMYVVYYFARKATIDNRKDLVRLVLGIAILYPIGFLVFAIPWGLFQMGMTLEEILYVMFPISAVTEVAFASIAGIALLKGLSGYLDRQGLTWGSKKKLDKRFEEKPSEAAKK